MVTKYFKSSFFAVHLTTFSSTGSISHNVGIVRQQQHFLCVAEWHTYCGKNLVSGFTTGMIFKGSLCFCFCLITNFLNTKCCLLKVFVLLKYKVTHETTNLVS